MKDSEDSSEQLSLVFNSQRWRKSLSGDTCSMRSFKNFTETPKWDTSTLENKTMALKVSPRLQRDWGFQSWKRSKICILIFLSPPSEPFQVANSTALKV